MINSDSWTLIVFILFYYTTKGGTSVVLSVSSNSVTEDSNVTFTCVTPSTNSPTLVIWDNGTTLGFLNNMCGELETGAFPINKDLYSYQCHNETAYSWTIRATSRYMNGEVWKCSMVIDGILRTSNGVTLNVIAPILNVNLTLPQTDTLNMMEHSSTTFQCITSGGIPGGHVRWYLGNNFTSGITAEDTEITENITNTQQIIAHGIVVIMSDLLLYVNRTMLDMIVYCSAHNGVGQLTSSDQKTRLNILYGTDGPPSILIKSVEPIQLIEDSPETLSCSITGGNPIPEVTWNCSIATATENNITGSTVFSTVIVNASRKQTLQCSCVSQQNISGIQMDTVNIEVLYPPDRPVLYIGSKMVNDSVRLFENASNSIVCTASGNPPPADPSDYVWTQPNGLSVQGSNLTISQLVRGDSGVYTCTVTNNMTSTSGVNTEGANSSQINILIQYPPSKPSIRYQNASGPEVSAIVLDVVKGDNFSLICTSGSEPEPDYLWSDGTSGRTLNVTSVDSDGWFSCTAANVMEDIREIVLNGSARSENVTTNVQYPPEEPIITFLVNGSFIEGSTGILQTIEGTEDLNVTCNATSKPDALYTWAANDSDVLWNASTFHISRVTRNHSATYTCTVNNNMTRTFGESVIGTNQKSFVLVILYPPRMQSMPTQTVTEGKEFSVQCPAIVYNPNATYFWWSRRNDSTTWNTRTINFPSINKTDADLYTCTVNSTLTPTPSMTPVSFESSTEFYIDVQYAASVVGFYIYGSEHTRVNESTVTLGESDQVSLMCDVDGNPEAYISIRQGDFILVQKSMASNLRYVNSNITCLDAGTYKCVGYNFLNNVSAVESFPSADVNLFVTCSPRPHPGFRLETELTAIVGQTVTFTFVVLAYPLPTQDLFHWHRINDSVWIELTGNRFKVSVLGSVTTLTIERLERLDYGSYGLIIDNGVGQNFSQLYYIKEPPVPKDEPDDHKKTMLIVAGVAAGLFAILLSVILTIIIYRNRHHLPCRSKGQSSKDYLTVSEQYPHVGQKRATSSTNDYESLASDLSKTYESLDKLGSCNVYEGLNSLKKLNVHDLPKAKNHKTPVRTAGTDIPPLPTKVCKKKKGQMPGSAGKVSAKSKDASTAGVYVDITAAAQSPEQHNDVSKAGEYMDMAHVNKSAKHTKGTYNAGEYEDMCLAAKSAKHTTHVYEDLRTVATNKGTTGEVINTPNKGEVEDARKNTQQK